MMENENPYASPRVPCPPKTEAVVYSSRWRATRADAWHGAKFGGKWMFLVISSLFAFSFASFIAGVLYLWLWKGTPLSLILKGIDLLEVFGMPLICILWMTLVTAAISAAIMGAGAAISWRKPSSGEDTHSATEQS
jgi:hypothetical protein